MSVADVVSALKEIKERVEKYQQLKVKQKGFGEKVKSWEERIFACQAQENWKLVLDCLKSANRKLNELDSSKGKSWERLLKLVKIFYNAEDYKTALGEIEDDIEHAISSSLIDTTQALERENNALKEQVALLANQPAGFVMPKLENDLVRFREGTVRCIAQKLSEGGSRHAVIGDGGAGKSCMLHLIRNYAEVQKRYGDRIRYYNRAREHLWRQEFVDSHLREALEEFDMSVRGCSTIDEAVAKVNVKLKANPDEPFLFLVDDVWTDEEVKYFLNLVQGSTSSMVYTSRRPRALHLSTAFNTVEVNKSLVEKEEESAIYEFAGRLSECAVDTAESKAIVLEIAKGLEFFPFNMQVIFKSCRSAKIKSWKEAQVMLKERKYDQSPIETALKLFKMSDASKTRSSIVALFRLAVLPHGSIRFNNHDALLMLGAESLEMAQETMALLSSCCAVTKVGDETYAVHDLYLDYLQSEPAQRLFLQKRLSVEQLEKELLSSLSAFFKKSTTNELDKFYTAYVQTRLGYLVETVVSQSKLSAEARKEFADPVLSRSLHDKGGYYLDKPVYSKALPLLHITTAASSSSNCTCWSEQESFHSGSCPAQV